MIVKIGNWEKENITQRYPSQRPLRASRERRVALERKRREEVADRAQGGIGERLQLVE